MNSKVIINFARDIFSQYCFLSVSAKLEDVLVPLQLQIHLDGTGDLQENHYHYCKALIGRAWQRG